MLKIVFRTMGGLNNYHLKTSKIVDELILFREVFEELVKMATDEEKVRFVRLFGV